MTEQPAFTTARALARRYGKSERTIRRWIASGALPSIKIGGSRLIPEDQLDARGTEASVRENTQSDEEDMEYRESIIKVNVPVIL
jgi:excisionase family DNA binding protein